MMPSHQSPEDFTITPPGSEGTPAPPAIGITPPQVLARDAAEGRRGAAWRLLHWIIEGNPQAFLAISSLDDDRLARHMLEFIALGTWAGKPFVVPASLRLPLARTQLRTLFLPGSGMDTLRAERVLLAGLHDRRAAVRENAAQTLGLMGRASAVAPLIETLRDPVITVQWQAAKALGQIGSEAAVPALLNMLHTADEQLAGQVSHALVQIGPAAVPALLKECDSPSPWIRWHCIRMLSEIHDYRALPTLVQALRDTNHSIAWLAARGLTRYGKWCIEPVLRLLILTETSPWLVETASYLLHDIYTRDQKFKPYLEPVVHSMHDVAYRIGTPNAARKALTRLTSDGLIATPS
ncbi:MAG: HEAT repeat domain-containing protein [Ktedonobacteraceae bacterium]|nr:HEAT repeat domain-containing protein [Ktedonobacteraceae bacterium]MBO0790042.1 HEAT repeat domain-containing protein [Ktedonobacteraceae bacterium]